MTRAETFPMPAPPSPAAPVPVELASDSRALGAGALTAADEWNAKHPIGEVMLHRWGLAELFGWPLELVTVESEAWECGGKLLVYISNRPNPALAEELEPINAH